MRFELAALSLLVLGIGCAGRTARVESAIPAAKPKAESKRRSIPRPARTEIVRTAPVVAAPVVIAAAPVKAAPALKVEKKVEKKAPILAGFMGMPMNLPKRAWHNEKMPSDVNRDGKVNQADKDAVFAQLKTRGPEELEGKPSAKSNLIDADADGYLTVDDAVYVMSDLNLN